MKLRIPTAAELKQAYGADLKAAFPPAELKPLWAIEALWARGRYEPWCLFEDERLLGECFLWLGAPGWALLDYLCVSPDRRNGGVGAGLLRELRARRPETVILAEVEAPEAAPDPETARRRLGFYARNGTRTAGWEADTFGVRYRLLYWADEELPDAELTCRYEEIYRGGLPPKIFARSIRLPLPPGGGRQSRSGETPQNWGGQERK